jgi:signal transduction histidine kinase
VQREKTVLVIAPAVWYIFILWLMTVLVYLTITLTRVIEDQRGIESIHSSYYFFAAIYAALLAYNMQGIEWAAAFMYVFDILFACLFLKWSSGIALSAMMTAGYALVRFLEDTGKLSGYGFPPGSGAGRTEALPPAPLWIMFFISFLTIEAALITGIKGIREKRVLSSRDNLEAKNRQLERVMTSLKKRLDEMEGIKNAAVRYVEDKEKELERVKDEKEKHIEDLRAAQRSMAFMIEDLNEMSAQLKEARDNLERKVAERTEELMVISQKLQRSEKLAFLGTISGSITHELRNPLGVIKNAVYGLEFSAKAGKKKDAPKYVGIIKKEVDMIGKIVEDIMGFARTKPPQAQRVSVNEIVDTSIARLNVPELIDIRKELDEALPEIEADPIQIQQAVVNIANNAIIAMKGNGILTFRTLIDKKNVSIEIEDNGPGISSEQRKTIFEPLYSTGEKGTGLGLPLAKMMVENNGGTISFTSEPGIGTKFRITLSVKKKGIDEEEEKRESGHRG